MTSEQRLAYLLIAGLDVREVGSVLNESFVTNTSQSLTSGVNLVSYYQHKEPVNFLNTISEVKVHQNVFITLNT